jgi:hypothetical protein
MHHGHVLSASHAAPPCFESRAKRVKRDGYHKGTAPGVALDDIARGDKVEIQ